MSNEITGFGGKWIDPKSADYDDARRVFNGLFDRRPKRIAQCAGPDDVALGLRFARERGWPVAVRGGGHSVAGFSNVDGALIIDLRAMRSVRLTDDGRRICIGAGALWRDVDVHSQSFGLATPGGVVSHTGVAGLTLNGGIGWLRNRYGLSSDNLIAAEIVTADGETMRVDEERAPDLLWALRGGGGNFGVVTEFEMAVHPVGPQVGAVFAMYDLEGAVEIVSEWRGWAERAPAEATSEVVLWTMPDWPQVAEAVRGRPVVIPSAVHVDGSDLGQRALEPLRHWGRRRHEIVGPMDFVDVQSTFDAFMPNDGSVLAYWKSLFVDELSDDMVDTLVDLAQTRSASTTMIIVQHVGKGVRSVDKTATAFHSRAGRYIINLMGMWRRNDESERHIDWVRSAWRRLAIDVDQSPYLNYLGAEEGADSQRLIRSAFGENFSRLQAIKRQFDPDNVFRFNQNIAP